MDNFTAHAGPPLWVIDWETESRIGVYVETVIGWTLDGGTLYPVVVPYEGMPQVRGGSKVSIYESETDANGDAEAHEVAADHADRAAAEKEAAAKP